MLPHLPPVGISPNSLMKYESDGPSSSSGDLMRTASVVTHDMSSRGMFPKGNPIALGEMMDSVKFPLVLVNSFPATERWGKVARVMALEMKPRHPA